MTIVQGRGLKRGDVAVLSIKVRAGGPSKAFERSTDGCLMIDDW